MATTAFLTRLFRAKSAATPVKPGWRSRISSHQGFSHDSIDSLGYDWERIADPNIPPRFPRKIYLPRSTEDVVKAVEEVRQLGEELRVRSKGHSSNDLVLTEGSVLLTEKLDAILEVDETNLTVTVEAGIALAQIDEHLATRGYGLPIIGTHNHITAGGFTSVGGISAAAHRHGLFVDNVMWLEYVNWDGKVVVCSRTERQDQFYRVLTGLGRYGVVTKVNIRIIPADKYGTILENDRKLYRDLDRFLAGAGRYIRDQGDVLYARVLWLDFALAAGRAATMGSVALYRNTEQTSAKRIRNAISYGRLHRVGYLAGRMPTPLEFILKLRGIIGIFLSPRYAAQKNVEIFLDRILDYTTGDPTRWIVMWAPIETYEALFRQAYQAMVETRKRHGCFTFVSCDLRPFRSSYLSHGDPERRWVDLVFEVGMTHKGIRPEVLDELISTIDDLCIEHGAYRYMHSKTVKDPERLKRIDPNQSYAGSSVRQTVAG
jgi:hypothetical protein